jgi:methionyl aminopeptidase
MPRFSVSNGVFMAVLVALWLRATHDTLFASPAVTDVSTQQCVRHASRLAAEILERLQSHVRPGTTTSELDALAHRWIVEEQRATPAPLHYGGLTGGLAYHFGASHACELLDFWTHSMMRLIGLLVGADVPFGMPLCGFPASICTSVNDVVVHGVPTETALKSNDIVNVDVTVEKDGCFGDTSMMFVVHEAGTKAQQSEPSVVRVAHEALWVGLAQVRPNATTGDIGAAIEEFVAARGMSVVRHYAGHGIGRGFHRAPIVYHYGRRGEGTKLVAGNIITIEPMVNTGGASVKIEADQWTVSTVDGSLSAQWEHTVLVTDSGAEVLSIRRNELPPLTELPSHVTWQRYP